MITAGVDVGSATTKAAVLDAVATQIVATWQEPTSWSPSETGARALARVLEIAELGREQVACVAGTGYGRFALAEADLRVTEITCHAQGAHLLAPETSTVIDIGGQDSKAIALAPDGKPETFAMNDKCAAGTGRFLEFMARALDVELMELGQLALHSEAPAPISSVCTVFAESEVVGLLADGVPREDIAAGLCRAVAQRAMALANQVGVREPVMVTGGVALNDGIIAALAAELGFEPLRVQAPQMVGAIGAASVGAERMNSNE